MENAADTAWAGSAALGTVLCSSTRDRLGQKRDAGLEVGRSWLGRLVPTGKAGKYTLKNGSQNGHKVKKIPVFGCGRLAHPLCGGWAGKGKGWLVAYPWGEYSKALLGKQVQAEEKRAFWQFRGWRGDGNGTPSSATPIIAVVEELNKH
jgi:hypothetical protein